MQTKPAQLSPLELRQKIAVRKAAELNGVSEATFRRHYSHLIRKITKRRDVVELGDAITFAVDEGFSALIVKIDGTSLRAARHGDQVLS
jgi:hypothetical protein